MRNDLTRERLAALLKYDHETGVFSWMVKPNSRILVGSAAGSARRDGYVRIKIDGTDYLAHRLAILYVTGAWPLGVAEHRDGNPSNNRWANLRDVAQAVNLQNQRRAHRRNKTGLLGVHVNGDGFGARICVGGVSTSLGTYSTPGAAHAAYVAAKRQFHEGNTL